jgi:hypothetical protein
MSLIAIHKNSSEFGVSVCDQQHNLGCSNTTKLDIQKMGKCFERWQKFGRGVASEATVLGLKCASEKSSHFGARCEEDRYVKKIGC